VEAPLWHRSTPAVIKALGPSAFLAYPPGDPCGLLEKAH